MDLVYNIENIGVNKLLFQFTVGTDPDFLFVMTNPWTAETKTGELPKEGTDPNWVLTLTGVTQPYEDLCCGDIYFDSIGLHPVSIYKNFISDVNLIAEVGFQVVESVPVSVPVPFDPITSFSYTNNNQTVTGTITPMTPIVVGDVAYYSVDANDTLPTGISLNQVTGIITGDFNGGSAESFDVIASGKDNVTAATVTVTISPAVVTTQFPYTFNFNLA